MTCHPFSTAPRRLEYWIHLPIGRNTMWETDDMSSLSVMSARRATTIATPSNNPTRYPWNSLA